MPKRVNNKWIFSDAEIDEQIARGKELYKKEAGTQPVAVRFSFDQRSRILSIRAKDGSGIDVPVYKLKELRDASANDIQKGYITNEGDAIHWDGLNAHYTVAGLAANIFGTQEWMRELGRIGGKQTSAAKATAARLNGQKGGRPSRTLSIEHVYAMRARPRASAGPTAKKPASRNYAVPKSSTSRPASKMKAGSSKSSSKMTSRKK